MEREYSRVWYAHTHVLCAQLLKCPWPVVVQNPPKLMNVVLKKLTVKIMNSSGISGIFMVLLMRRELPEYYQIIKKPIDLKKIKVCACVCVCNGQFRYTSVRAPQT